MTALVGATTDEIGLSFAKGLVAAVNPCAFVLLPTYLMLFLGLNDNRSARASLRRALVVSGAVSAGFLTVFAVVGVISEYLTDWIKSNAKYATLVIGAVFVLLGAAMLAGYRPRVGPLGVARASKRIDATGRGMFVYGVAYAVASLGCTLPLFLTTVFGGGRRDGFGKATANVLAYAVAMTLIVTALTVALAFANAGLAKVLRAASQYTSLVGAAFVLLSGLYLIYYFWVVDIRGADTSIVSAVDRLQTWVQERLVGHTWIVAIGLAGVVAAAVTVVRSRHGGRSGERGRFASQ